MSHPLVPGVAVPRRGFLEEPDEAVRIGLPARLSVAGIDPYRRDVLVETMDQGLEAVIAPHRPVQPGDRGVLEHLLPPDLIVVARAVLLGVHLVPELVPDTLGIGPPIGLLGLAGKEHRHKEVRERAPHGAIGDTGFPVRPEPARRVHEQLADPAAIGFEAGLIESRRAADPEVGDPGPLHPFEADLFGRIAVGERGPASRCIADGAKVRIAESPVVHAAQGLDGVGRAGFIARASKTGSPVEKSFVEDVEPRCGAAPSRCLAAMRALEAAHSTVVVELRDGAIPVGLDPSRRRLGPFEVRAPAAERCPFGARRQGPVSLQSVEIAAGVRREDHGIGAEPKVAEVRGLEVAARPEDSGGVTVRAVVIARDLDGIAVRPGDLEVIGPARNHVDPRKE